MYAYVDETGNTGSNIFDEHQPQFLTAALISKVNIDVLEGAMLRRLANKIGKDSLHANEIGEALIDEIASEIGALLETRDCRFFVSRIEKKYLAVTKLVDTLFDSFENRAVPWHVYNLRPMRLMLVFKVASILTIEVAETFWSALLEPNKPRAYERFLEALSELRKEVGRLEDKRSKELVIQAIDWATANPEAIYVHTNSQSARTGHLPNLAVFPNLLDGIEKRSRLWDRKVVEVVHDRQSQFEKTLAYWHKIYANAAPDVISWAGEKHSLRRLPGSSFRVSSSAESAGIQLTDVILWLFKRVIDGRPIPPRSAHLISFVLKRSYQNDLSFKTVGGWLEEFFADLYSKPWNEDLERKGKAIVAMAEQRRQEGMARYAEGKLKQYSAGIE